MAYTRKEVERLRNEVRRFARTGKVFGSLRRFASGRSGNAIVDLLGIVLGSKGPKRRKAADLSAAVELLRQAGYNVAPGGQPITPPPVPPPRTVTPPPAQPPIQPQRDIWPAEHDIEILPDDDWPDEHDIEIIEDTWPAEHTIDTRLRTGVPRARTMEGRLDEAGLSKEIKTPQSSNVYSMQYDYPAGILYITYRAPGQPTGYKKMRSICSGKMHSVAIRPNVPGATYSYGGASRPFPRSQWESIKRAHSKGQWIWENIRDCETKWRHQYPYTLVSGVPLGGGATYIPRKLTSKGFRVRSVPQPGKGKRGFRVSTLPERLF